MRAEPAEDEAPGPLPLAVFGASAGGVDALTRVMAHLPASVPFASVVLTHLDPHQESHLVEVLQRHAPLPVHWLEDGTVLDAGQIYALPPGQLARLRDRRIELTPRTPGPNLPIDRFLASAAQDGNAQLAAIVLSGTGNDGTTGALAVKAGGGLVIAQDPNDAAHDGMPLALIDEQIADRVLAPEAVGEALRQYFAPAPARTPAEQAQQAADALALVRAQFGLDLGYYKEVNVRRRLLRRAFLQSGGDVDAYLQRLRDDAGELALLRDDLLIGVTAFFRDDEFVDALERHVLPDLIDRPGDAIRVWVPACSTGEEAYSIAMLLHHMLEAAGIARKVQIFGSDVNEAAVRHARAGRYTAAAVASLPEFYRSRYLEQDANGWRVAKPVRELCLFAVHNVFTNAPFSNVDLVSARNFLIYLRKPAKRAAFEAFFYALRRNGYLMLGPSEAPDPELFEETGTAGNLYRRRQITRPPLRGFAFTELPSAAAAAQHDPGAASLESLVDRLALARYAPPGFVVDVNGRVVQFRGDTSPLLQPTGGDATLSLAKLVRPELQVDVRAALMEAVRSKLPVRRERLRLGDRHCTLDVVPVPAGGSERYFLVSVQDCEPTAPPVNVASDARAEDLERYVRVLGEELEQTRAQLKAVVTEYDATGEELRTANEEILSSNEELQSANEDLRDAKRDLEGANADLNALNRELERRNEQLVSLNDDLGNLIRGIPVPVLMLGRDQGIRHYSPAAAELFGFGDAGVGQELTSSTRFAPDVLNPAVEEALRDLRPVEREVQDLAGRWYVLSARAYQTSENRIEGAVLALQDVHHLKLALETANLARAEAERANAAKNDFLALVSHELRAPLNVISNWIQLLRTLGIERGADPRAGQALAAIERSCKDQARLIDDLLDISRITSGKLVLDLRPTDFAAVTRAMIEAVEPVAAAKGIALSSSGLGDSVMLAGDMRRLQQIVANVLENAVKFTPRGGHVDVALVRLDTSVELTVADTGMGITAEELPRIFERFSQGDISKTRRHGGLGLGLSIVRSLADAHGGSVAAMSDGRDRGARFVVRLPLSPSSVSRADAAPRPPSPAALSLRGIGILLVDDEPSGRDALAHMLRALGADIEVAGSAAEALEKLERRAFDALIADIAMPGTDGYQLIRAVRQRDAAGGGRPVYAIALTGFTSAGEREEALAAGYDAHFGKPPDIAEIAARAAAGVRARDAARPPE